MSFRVPVDLKFPGRDVKFVLNADPTSTADANTAFYLARNGYCEPEVAHLMARVIREGDHVIDIGANIGFFTLLLAKLVGPNGAVTAFEPSPGTFAKLRENVRLNGFKHVSCMQQALSDKVKSAHLHMAMDSGRNALARSPSTISAMPLTTAPLKDSIGASTCRLIKMDAEGAELDIALGAGHLFTPAATPYIVSELNNEALVSMNTTPARYRKWMHTIGYDMFLLHDNGALPTMVPPRTTIEGETLNVNVLFSTLDAVAQAWPEVVLCA